MNTKEISVGMTVRHKNMRGTIRLIYSDAPYVKVITFPQDVKWVQSLMFQKWPIDEIYRINK